MEDPPPQPPPQPETGVATSPATHRGSLEWREAEYEFDPHRLAAVRVVPRQPAGGAAHPEPEAAGDATAEGPAAAAAAGRAVGALIAAPAANGRPASASSAGGGKRGRKKKLSVLCQVLRLGWEGGCGDSELHGMGPSFVTAAGASQDASACASGVWGQLRSRS